MGTAHLVVADSSQIVAPAVAEIVEAAAPVEGGIPGVACGNQAVGMAFPRAGLAFAHRGWDHLGVERAGMACRGRELVLWIKRNRSVVIFVHRRKWWRGGLTRNKASGSSVWNTWQAERGRWKASYV